MRPTITPRYSSTNGVVKAPAPIAVPARVKIEPLMEPGLILPKARYDQELLDPIEEGLYGLSGSFSFMKVSNSYSSPCYRFVVYTYLFSSMVKPKSGSDIFIQFYIIS